MFILPEQNAMYFVAPKCASASIRNLFHTSGLKSSRHAWPSMDKDGRVFQEHVTIKDWIKCKDNVPDAEDYPKARRKQDFEEYFTYSFVRNPYERLYSCYLQDRLSAQDIPKLYALFEYDPSRRENTDWARIWIHDCLPGGQWYNAWHGFFSHNDDFNDYVTKFVDFDNLSGFNFVHWVPMWKYCYYKKLKVNFIGKIESYEKDVKFLCEKFGVKFKNKKFNVAGNASGQGLKKDGSYIHLYKKETIGLINEVYKKDFELFDYKMIKV